LIRSVVLAAVVVSFLLAATASGQNTTGVFGPEVTPGERSAEVRVAFAPRSDGSEARVASRIHYQHAVTDTLRLRAVLQGADRPGGSDFDFDFVQFEAQWQFLEDETHGWDSALRLDGQIAQDRADLTNLHWSNDVPLGESWVLRGILLAGFQIGDSRASGLFLQTRASLRYKLSPNYSLQVQVFNLYGSTANMPAGQNQNHSVGPAVAGKLGRGWSFEASTLFGVTRAAPDADLRLFLTKAF